jgi:hypothetical protein
MDGWNGRPIGLQPYLLGEEAPLSGDGDLDEDGASNRDEYRANGGAAGSRAAFAQAAAGG